MLGYGIRDQQQKNGVDPRDDSAGIWDQHNCMGIRDPVVRHNNKDCITLNAP